MASSGGPEFPLNKMEQTIESFDTISLSSMISPKYEYVVALDIGTTYSAYAYAHKDDIDLDKNQINITCNQAWSAGKYNCITMKSPTSVLLDDHGDLDLFGYDAEDKYGTLVKEKAKNYFFFRRFKMNLYDKNPTSKMLLKDVNGRQMLAETVFARAISALRQEFETSVTTRGIHLNPNEVRWVLTVPAIWSEAAKRFMRKCANVAGIQNKQLIIALEPEAASIYCQYIKSKDISDPTLTISGPGTQYMVVDLGGGTVDIAVHEKLKNGYLKEIYQATGGDCGGNSINESLVQELVINFGGPLIEAVAKDHPKEYYDIHREFEAAKKSFNPLKENDMVLRLPFIFLNNICEKMKNENVEQILQLGPHSDKLRIEHDYVYISANLVRTRLLEPTAKRIRDLVTNIIFKVNNPRLTRILLVGGLADSVYIQNFVQKAFPNNKIIVPQDADLCVIKGAVMFGHSPQLISHRVSRFTYGTEIIPLFDISKHDEKRKKNVDGQERCSGVFDLYASSGTVLEIDTPIKKSYCTSQRYQKSMDLSVFASTNDSPMYTDEDECEKIGNFVITLKNPTEEIRSVDVTVVFGNTELKVYAVDKTSGEKCDASFDLPLF